MKTLKLFMMLVVSLTLCFTASSCGNDDDDVPTPQETNVTLKKSDKQIVLTYAVPQAWTQVWTATFDGSKKCTSYICKTTYANAELAHEAWRQLQVNGWEEGTQISYDGKLTITKDYTSLHANMSYEEILQYLEHLKEEYQRHANEQR